MNHDEIRSTRDQITEVVALLRNNRVVLKPDAVMRIKDDIQSITEEIIKQYPYIGSRLQTLRNQLFIPMEPGYKLSFGRGDVLEQNSPDSYGYSS